MAFLKSKPFKPSAIQAISTVAKLADMADSFDAEVVHQNDSAVQYRGWAQEAVQRADLAREQAIAVKAAAKILAQANVTI